MVDSIVALNIKDAETERLAAEVATLAGENKTQAIRRALAERKERLAFQVVPVDRLRAAYRFLEQEVWPVVPKSARGRRLTRKEEARILGYGPEGF
jgi:antitoxin VapB